MDNTYAHNNLCTGCLGRSKGNLRKVLNLRRVLSLPLRDPREQTLVISLNGKHLHLLSYLAGSSGPFSKHQKEEMEHF